MDVVGNDANEFRLILRQSNLNSFDFSVIFALKPKNSNQLFRLRRYNGKHGEHTNIIEGTKISGFHIHYATERYQRLGTREDAYAEATDRYSNLDQALSCMLQDCGFEIPIDPQGQLFEDLS